nr:PIN domain-containing protein [Thermoanaerobacter italicus]
MGGLLDKLSEKRKLNEGVPLKNRGSIKIELNHISNESLKQLNNDDRILSVALNLFHEEQKEENPIPVILGSQDMIIRIKEVAELADKLL